MNCRCHLLCSVSHVVHVSSQACTCYLGVHTRTVVGSSILIGAVLLALSAPLRGSVCDEKGCSSQDGSSVGKHVVMLHNSTI